MKRTRSNLNKMVTLLAQLLRLALGNGKGRLFLIIILDAFSAAAKILSVLIIALAVRILSLGQDEAVSYIGVSFEASSGWILVLGISLGAILLIGAACAFGSAWLSRRLGRTVNEKVMEDMFSALRIDPGRAVDIQFEKNSNVNVLLTQVPIHTGLAAETVARLINPLILLLFAGLSLVYQQPVFAFSVMLVGILFLPIFLRFSRNVQSTADKFYSRQAMEFGREVGSIANQMINQHAIISKAGHRQETLSRASEFFSAYDSNLLANERAAWIISFADGVLRALVFVVLCLLVLQGEFSAEAAVLFLGALAYALTSARQVASLMTNLLRYQPQAQRYFNVLAKVSDAIAEVRSSGFNGKLIVPQDDDKEQNPDRLIEPGMIVLVGLTEPISVLSIGRYRSQLFGSTCGRGVLENEIALANGNFRFAPISVMEQLCGSTGNTAEATGAARTCCVEMGADADFGSLPDGYDTILGEGVWRSLGAQARVALRLVPLAVNTTSAIVVIDVDIIRALGEKAQPLIKRWFGDRIVFLISASDQKFADPGADIVFTVDRNGKPEICDWQSFPAAMGRISSAAIGDTGDAAMLGTLA